MLIFFHGIYMVVSGTIQSKKVLGMVQADWVVSVSEFACYSSRSPKTRSLGQLGILKLSIGENLIADACSFPR